MVIPTNKHGKFMLVDADKKLVAFDYAVDASEALRLKDKDGEARYTLPVQPKKGLAAKKIEKEKDQIEDIYEGEVNVIEEGSITEPPEKKREVKVLSAAKRKRQRRREGQGKKE